MRTRDGGPELIEYRERTQLHLRLQRMMGVQPPVEWLDGDRNPVGAPARVTGTRYTYWLQIPVFWWFEPTRVHYADVSQLAEEAVLNTVCEGSNPSIGTTPV